jgi:hypothetical protein
MVGGAKIAADFEPLDVRSCMGGSIGDSHRMGRSPAFNADDRSDLIAAIGQPSRRAMNKVATLQPVEVSAVVGMTIAVSNR